MSQADEKQTDKRNEDEERLERERASGNKLWGVYISEAEKYDQGLIDGWRSDMDGLLIFAGLFSGVVTTLIIDSYKTLSPDSGSQTVALLTHISLQLANMHNGTAVTDALPPTAPFSPPISALVCNALWFTSLALSLSSALVATLVEQWAREYQHRTTMFSSISIRSRVYMYLYHGLQRFNMHAVVGIPLLLLHGALVLFFAGLVAFLVPINDIIMAITSALLLLFVSAYGAFTVLPLLCFDSPYQTPLTGVLWSLNQSLGSVLRAHVCKARVQNRVSQTDQEALTAPAAPGDNRDQNHCDNQPKNKVEKRSEFKDWRIQPSSYSIYTQIQSESYLQLMSHRAMYRMEHWSWVVVEPSGAYVAQPRIDRDNPWNP
ncbi:unnamed protein product [Mycena citricolor]|uniref:DUF6535 domain-containing protein n=1 Tax=Mycena citricolor TaxID=2018698 RepID=A0AAD2K5I6_9AGAR|nr:unnamed protein product [Mycena citricolor]